MSIFLGKQVLVVGLGVSGRSAVEFLLAHGAFVSGVDRDPQMLASHPEIQALKQAGLIVYVEKEFQDVARFDLMVVSPGVPLNHPLVQAAQRIEIPMIGEIELGCQVAKNPMLGITGTNGKTTVTLLVTHVLKQSRKSAQALGNVGIPFTRELLSIDSQSTIVLELSSYQIETLHQRCLEAALILNITPDHLDRYSTMEAYAKAKCEIERALKSGRCLYMEENAWRQYGYLLQEGKPRLYGYDSSSFIQTDLFAVYRDGKKMFELPDLLKKKKSHDLENLLAAYALCSDQGVTGVTFIEAWKTFKKPAHRIEFVTEHRGVRYYDDSKGTNIDAVIRAVQSLEGAIILIAGGVDKGAAYTPWLEEFKNKVKLICAIGQAAGKIHEQLDSQIPVMMFHSLDEAVLQASRFAQKGDNVLLSPGCSSFDMFKDYAHRGEEFQRIVRTLCALIGGD
jgi:UDP-N-acetylmuramoylalanine--D-glutamate ligase